MNMAENFIPNSFQTPNSYVDDFMHYLTPEEYKVLIYAARRIFGFNKRQDAISISQFSNGITLHDGRVLDLGTGLSPKTVKRALNGLIRAGLLIRLERAKPDRTPALYALQLDADRVDMDYLRDRRQAKKTGERRKMDKARGERGSRTGCVPPKRGSYKTPVEQGTSETPVQGSHITNDGGLSLPTQRNRDNQKKQQELSFISSLDEDEREFLTQVEGISLDGTLDEKQAKHWLSQREAWGAGKVLGFLEWAQRQGHSFEQAFNVDRKYEKVKEWQFSRRGESRVEFTVDDSSAVTPWEVWETGRREKCRVEEHWGKLCYVTHDGFEDDLPRLGEKEWLGDTKREFTSDGWIELEPNEGDVCDARVYKDGEWHNLPKEGDVHLKGDFRILLNGGDVHINELERFHGGEWIPATVEEANDYLEFHRRRHVINLITESEPAYV